MRTCPKCGAEAAQAAKFCVMCGTPLGPQPDTRDLGTATLTGSGGLVTVSTAAIAAGILFGVVVLVLAWF